MRKITEDFIGTCQACFGEFKVSEDIRRIVLHGYKRPGDGYGIIGQCPGTNDAPFEYDTSLTKRIIDFHRAEAEKEQHRQSELSAKDFAGPLTRYWKEYNEDTRRRETLSEEVAPGHAHWSYTLKAAIQAAISRHVHHTGMADYLDAMVKAWKRGQIVGIDVPATGKARALRKAYDPAEAAEADKRAAEKAARDAKPGKLKVIFYQPELARAFEPGDSAGHRAWIDGKYDQEAKFLADVKALVKAKFPGKTRVATGYSSDVPRTVARGDYDVVVASLPWEYRIEMEALLPGVAPYETEAKRRSYTFYGVPANSETGVN